jgi:hypothetical protein
MIRFYATVDVDSMRPELMPRNVSYMLPASSFWRKGFPTPRLPEGVDVAADCGGYVMTKIHGGYPYGMREYDAWLTMIPRLRWAAMFDYCCEDDLTAGELGYDVADVFTRQRWTTELARSFVENFGYRPWAWVPTVQGWEVDDYRRHAERIAPLVFELQRWYEERQGYDYFTGDEDNPADVEAFEFSCRASEAFRVGIGTLCRRASPSMIRDVVAAVSEVLPDVPLHLWGVKLSALSGGAMPPAVVSSDSAAWNQRFGSGLEGVKGSGMTQREYGYRVALPTYHEKFEKLVNGRTTGRVTGRRRKTS